MSKPPLPLTTLSEAQGAQAARTHQIPASTIQFWIKRYREKETIT
jgi:hypothetical protein